VTTLRLGQATVEMHDGWTLTTLPGGDVPARAQDNDDYRERAAGLGYGADTALMSREHEVMHSLLATWLGLPCSPTLQGVATGKYARHWCEEEAAVLALQRLCRCLRIDVVSIAKARSH
jgi:hypothetical protein